ncbi:GDP-mannose 4,6-dehydratase [Staphylococcus felis]|uniref:GDP-mannose 4,6-dehydratase n=1 Tax=Staphylococcus felis TaxID=46127 RepID=UPI000E248B1B|nr:NAD-dependent epimerase/dehydratase family protein [Staphylococcus felis]REI04656.1 NAD-dependent dehydratase [Staphylococcus felis]
MGDGKAKVLITGGAGFIGSNLAKYFFDKGEEVFVLDNLSTGHLENISFLDKSYFFKGDITDTKFVEEVFDNHHFDIVVHLAAVVSVVDTVNDPITSQKVNIQGTLDILKIIKEKNENIKRFLFASSAAVYGNTSDLPKKMDSLISPESPYAIEKFSGEQYTKLFYKLYGIPTTALRFFNIYGPKQDPNSQYSGVISIMMDCFENNKTFTFYGDGEQSRDFVYITDLIKSIELILSDSDSIGRIYNVGTGNSTSLNEVFNAFCKIYEKRIPVKYEDFRNGDVKHSLADILPLKKIGYEPEYDINKGLEEYFKVLNQ